MRRYFLTRCKQLLRSLPGVLLAMALLLGCLGGIFFAASQSAVLSEENSKVRLAMVGTAEDPLLSMGLMALEAYDTSRLTLEITPMEEQQAADALANGTIAAYVVIPEGFVTEAYRGNILPLRFVSSAGATGLVSIFKTEFTKVITHMLIAAQKGTYAMADMAMDSGIALHGHMDDISLHYAEYVFYRDRLYTVTTLGVSDSLGALPSLMCGICVVFLCLLSLPFAPQMIRKDHHLSRMLAASGVAPFRQALADFAAYALSLLALVFLLLAGAGLCLPKAVEPVGFFPLFWRMGVVTVVFAALSFLLYNLSSDLIGGVLVQFFLTVALCFAGGCLYPVYFFPVALQRVGSFLPTATASTLLSTGVSGNPPTAALLLLGGYGALFFLIGAGVYCRRTKEVGL